MRGGDHTRGPRGSRVCWLRVKKVEGEGDASNVSFLTFSRILFSPNVNLDRAAAVTGVTNVTIANQAKRRSVKNIRCNHV